MQKLQKRMNNEIQKQGRGGYRGGVRPSTGRDIPVCVRLSRESVDKLNGLTRNKSEFIDNMLKNL